MTDPQTLEEAWRNHGLALTSEELDDTARALALAVLAEAIDTSPRIKDMPDLRYRIVALGR